MIDALRPSDDLPKPAPRAARRCRGFETAAKLVARHVGSVGESRGFSVSRLLTHWVDVVGEDIAARCRPVKISHGRGGFGATLVLLTTGTEALRLEMALPEIRARVNACYGFNAVARISLTQTAADGFSEGRPDFTPAARRASAPAPASSPAEIKPSVAKAAASAAEGISDPDLAAAVNQFALLYLSRGDAKNKGSSS